MDRIWLSFKKKIRRFKFAFAVWILIVSILSNNFAVVAAAEFKASVVVSSSRGVFNKEPKNVIASLGDTVELPCSAVDEDDRRLKNVWTFEGSVENIQILPDHYRAPNGSLILRNVGMVHEGTFRCAVLIQSKTVGVLLSASANLSIARIKRFVEEPQDTVVYIGGVARFSCKLDAIPSATVVWYHNDLPVIQNDQRFRILNSGILQIVDVVRSDQGDYYCFASNGLSNVTSRSAKLTTSKESTRPTDLTLKIVRAPQNASAVRGSSALFECLFGNIPPVDVTWKRTDGVLPETARQIGSNLHISNVEPWYDGQYECTAKFGDKEFRLKANLSVDSVPEIRDFPQEHIKRKGESARFICNTVSNPRPEIIWYKNGEPVKPEGRIKMFPPIDDPPDTVISSSGETHYKRDLLITSIRRDDSALYECFATNYLGEVGGASLLVYLEDDGPSAPPENLQAKVSQSDKSIHLSWSVPSELPDNRIAAFIVHFHSIGEVENTHAVEPKEACINRICRTQCCGVTTSLKSYTNYTFWVSALLDSGTFTLPSNETVITTWDEVTAAPAPLIIQEVNESGSVRLLWDSLSPSLQRGEAVEYRIEYKEADSETVSVHHVPYVIKEYLLTNLKLDVVYLFRVIPKTRAGYPLLFVPKENFVWLKFRLRNTTILPSPLLTAPLILCHPLNNTAIFVDFHPGKTTLTSSADDDSSISYDDYRLLIKKIGNNANDNDIVIFNVTSPVVPTVIGSLESSTWYQIVVFAVNNNDSNGLSTSRTVRTMPKKDDTPETAPVLPLVPYPNDIRCHVTNARTGRIRITWSQPQTYDAVRYMVRYSFSPDGDELLNVSSVKFKETTKNSVDFNDLSPGRTYLFAVKTEASVGWSKYSDDIECSVPMTVLSAPLGVSFVVLSNSSVLLAWMPPRDYDSNVHDVLQYKVRYRADSMDTSNGGSWREIIVNGTQYKVVLTDLVQAELYFIIVAAETESGVGIFSAPIPVVIPATTTTTRIVVVERTSYTEGIVIGVCIAVVCVFIVLVLKARRNNRGGWSWRICPWSQRTDHMANGGTAKAPNGHVPNGHCSKYCDKVELVTLLPPLIENTACDSKGGSDAPGLCYVNGFSQQVAVNGFHKPLLMQSADQPLTVTIDSPSNGNIVQPVDQSSDLSQSAATGSSLHSWSTHCPANGHPSTYCNGANNNVVHRNPSNEAPSLNRRSRHTVYSSLPNLTDSGIGFDEVVCCNNSGHHQHHHHYHHNSNYATNNTTNVNSNNNNYHIPYPNCCENNIQDANLNIVGGNCHQQQTSITPPASAVCNGRIGGSSASPTPPSSRPPSAIGGRNGFFHPKSGGWLQDFLFHKRGSSGGNGIILNKSNPHQGTAAC